MSGCRTSFAKYRLETDLYVTERLDLKIKDSKIEVSFHKKD